jgi:hypothetical protein
LVATLGTIDYILHDHAAATAHVSGMRQLVKIRGNAEPKTPWNRLVQANIAAYESLWSFLFAVDSKEDEVIATPEENRDGDTTIAKTKGSLAENGELALYLAHPFPPHVCSMLSKIPRGFCDVGLTGVLSLQIIRIQSDIADLTKQLEILRSSPSSNDSMTSSPNSSSSSTTISPNSNSSETTLPQPPSQPIPPILPHFQTLTSDLHRLSTLQTTPAERFLCHGLVAYIFLLRLVFFSQPITHFYDATLIAFANYALKTPPTAKQPERKCYLWSHLTIATACYHAQTPNPQWVHVMRFILERYVEARSWRVLEREMRAGFWAEKVQGLFRVVYEDAVRRRDLGWPTDGIPASSTSGGSSSMDDDREHDSSSSSSSSNRGGQGAERQRMAISNVVL